MLHLECKAVNITSFWAFTDNRGQSFQSHSLTNVDPEAIRHPVIDACTGLLANSCNELSNKRYSGINKVPPLQDYKG